MTPEQGAHRAFIEGYRAGKFGIDYDAATKAFRYRFGRRPKEDWQERRIAILILACSECRRVARTLPGGKARRLIAEKYDGILLGIGVEKRPIFLRLSQLTLWRFCNLMKIHRGSDAIDSLRLMCGTRKSLSSDECL